MKYYQEINCPHCGSSQLGKAGFNAKGIQHNSGLSAYTFLQI
jgi:transposase-like protein